VTVNLSDIRVKKLRKQATNKVPKQRHVSAKFGDNNNLFSLIAVAKLRDMVAEVIACYIETDLQESSGEGSIRAYTLTE
jgi:hypothetical protein